MYRVENIHLCLGVREKCNTCRKSKILFDTNLCASSWHSLSQSPSQSLIFWDRILTKNKKKNLI